MPEIGNKPKQRDDLFTPEGRAEARARCADEWLQYGIEKGKRMNRSIPCNAGIHRTDPSHERCSFGPSNCWCECHDDQTGNVLLP